jgi:hypothetical protein
MNTIGSASAEMKDQIDAALREADIDPEDLRPPRPAGLPADGFKLPSFDDLTDEQQEHLRAILEPYQGEAMTPEALYYIEEDLRDAAFIRSSFAFHRANGSVAAHPCLLLRAQQEPLLQARPCECPPLVF